MAKATKPINTPSRYGVAVRLPLAKGAVIYAGTLVAVDENGYAVPASDTANLKVVGRANGTADNSEGEVGGKEVDVERGIFRYTNSTSKPITRADWNSRVFVEDDNTVAKSSTNSVCAGVMVGIDDVGVWVDTKQSAIPASA